MRYHLYALGSAICALLPTVVVAQALLPTVSARLQTAQVEDERERLTILQTQTAAQIAALPPPLVPASPAVQAAEAAAPAEPSVDKYKDGQGTFAGLKLGVGLSFTLDIGKLDRISEAEIVGGVVRVKDQDNGRARIMLESHYFFTPCGDFLAIPGLVNNPDTVRGDGRCNSDDYMKARWGWGPFIAIQPGSGEIIDAIGAGVMFGFRRQNSNQSFNLGFGIVVDPNTRVLGDGFVKNQGAPSGENTVRYRETLQTGILLLTSFSF